jgi:hypothetical protein
VVHNNDGQLGDFLKEYWKQRLGSNPCNCDEVNDTATIGENIPNYRFAYSDIVVARKSFTGIREDDCQNTNLITNKVLHVDKGDKVNIVMGTSIFPDRGDRYDFYDPSGQNTATAKALVRQEMDAVQRGQLSVTFDGQQLVQPEINYRVGPVEFDLVVPPDSKLADRMEYPIEPGTYNNTWTGGHCMVVEMNTEGRFNVRVDFDGVRGYKNRTETILVVT